mgnify:CR=1 FL=1
MGNSFKNLLILQVKPEFRSKANFEKLALSLRSSPGIYEVSYPENYLELIKISNTSNWFLLCCNYNI